MADSKQVMFAPTKPRTSRLKIHIEDAQIRLLDCDDANFLGELLYDAYKGTQDDEGETIEQARMEARATLAGEYGKVIWNASFVLERNRRLAGVSLVTMFRGEPLLAFSAVEKESQRCGVASCLIDCSLDALLQENYQNLRLYVTKSNSPAMSLYNKLNFEIAI